MKTIFKVTNQFYITSLIMLLTGSFKPFLFILLLILIHEIGHILITKLLNFKIISITLFPFGALTKLDMKLNDSVFKDLLIALAGPIFQIIGYNALKTYFDFHQIHYFLLLFNLLPIHPLDGSKLLSNILYLVAPFKLVTNIIIVVSTILSFFFFSFYLINFQLIYIIAFLLLINKVFELYKSRKYLFNAFLLEKMNYDFKYPFTRKINNLFNMYKCTFHYIYNGNEYEEEKSYLNKKYRTYIK